MTEAGIYIPAVCRLVSQYSVVIDVLSVILETKLQTFLSIIQIRMYSFNSGNTMVSMSLIRICALSYLVFPFIIQNKRHFL